MGLLNKDIDRPLGQSGAKTASRRRLVPNAGAVTSVAAVLGILSASTFVAMQDKGLRDPSTVVVAAAPAAQTANNAPLATKNDPMTVGSVERKTLPGGAAVIKVTPDPSGENDGNAIIAIRDPTAVGQNLQVAHLPERALIEQSEGGPLPVRAADGRRPFDVYARPWSGARGARIAIVIGGLGLSQTGTQAAIDKLPPEVTLGFAPQGNSLNRWMQTARRKGHELVLQLPLEPFDYPNVNPGRNTLTIAASAEENARNLHAALSRITNYTGVMNYMGARFVADGAAMAPLMAELGERGLMYLDDGSSARTVAPQLAAENKVPLASADATIDGTRDRGEILKKLDELERTARAKGYALGTGTAFDVTVDTVTSWAAEARRRGIEIVPVSAVALDPEKG